MGVGPTGVGAVGVAAPSAGADVEEQAAGADRESDAGAAVLAVTVLFSAAFRGEQSDFVVGAERDVVACGEIGAPDREVAVLGRAAGDDGDILAG